MSNFFQCPVYDLARNVEFTGFFQTMTTKAAITVEVSRLFLPPGCEERVLMKGPCGEALPQGSP